jgi:hypothetical protein
MVHCCQKENTHAKCESNTKTATRNVQRLSPLLTLTDGPLRAQALCEVVCLEAKGIEIDVGVSTWILDVQSTHGLWSRVPRAHVAYSGSRTEVVVKRTNTRTNMQTGLVRNMKAAS